MSKHLFDELRKISGGKLNQSQVDATNRIIEKSSINDVLEMLGVNNMILTKENLLKIYPSADIEFLELINKYGPLFDINTKKRLALFVAHSLHESGGFNKLQESFAYKPDRLLAVFPSRVKTLSTANYLVAKGKEAIANFLYGNRYGNTGPNDGWLYSGKGLGGLTFKDNYINMQKIMKEYGFDYDIVSNPFLLLDKTVATISFMCYWKSKNLNAYADKNDIIGSTKAINGGLNGLEERKKLYQLALKHL